VEHPLDEEESDPAGWPREYDSIRVALGPALFREESFDDLPPDVNDDTF
jgi:hypothetical protein